MNSESIDKHTRHISDVQRFESMFQNQPIEDTEADLNELRITVSDRWEACNRSFKALFEILNKSSSTPVNLFDIKINKKQIGTTTHESFIRVWRDQQEGSYQIRTKVRIDGRIEDYLTAPELSESFSDTYTYRFGTAHSHQATVKLHDTLKDKIMLEREDGKIVNGVSLHEMAVLRAALGGHVLPSIEKVEDSLLTIWEAISSDELNPALAKVYREYINYLS